MSTPKRNQAEALREVWEVLLRFRWRFLLPAFLVATGVLAASFFIPRRYKAEAIFERRTDMVLAEIINKGAPQSFQDPRQSLVEEVAGQPSIDELVDKLAADPPSDGSRQKLARDRDAVAADLSRKVQVTHDISSIDLDRVRVSLVSEDPSLARAAVNTLVQSYLDRTRARLDGRLKASSDFFRTEVERNRKLIEEIENKKLTFEINHAGLLPDSPTNVQNTLGEAEAQLATQQQQRDAAPVRVAALEKTLAETPTTLPSTTVSRDPRRTDLESKLADLQNQLATLVGVQQMTEKHPDVVAMHQRIAGMQAEIDKTETEVVTQRQSQPNPRRSEIELMLTGARAEAQSTDAQCKITQTRIESLNAESGKLFPIRSDYMKLNRQIDETQRQLAFWEDNLRRVDMSRTAEDGKRGVQLSLVKPCDELRKPVSPDIMQVLMAALGLGVLTGGVGVFLAHRGDESCTGDDLAGHFELPVFGSVGEIISRRQRAARRVKMIVGYPAVGLGMAVVVLGLGGVLYLNLARPELYADFRRNPVRFLKQQVQSERPLPAAAMNLPPASGTDKD